MKQRIHPFLCKAAAIVAGVILVAGCSAPAAPSAPVTPTVMQIIVVTSTPEPTSTKPAATATTAPTPTIAVPTATPTVIPTATPDPNVNPFTGLALSPTDTKTIPVLIKVSNSPEVRPQSALALADVVVEHYSEGGITRFTALFHTNLPDKVGSVRSCRLIDIELPVIFGAGIVCSGTSGGTRQKIFASGSWADSGGDVRKTVWMVGDQGNFECLQPAGCPLPMYRTSEAYPPHNLFASTHNALAELVSRGLNKPTTFNTWSFSTTAPDGGKSAASVNIPYSSGVVGWVYDAKSGAWSRSIGGVPHFDAITGAQLTSTNVAVLYVNHVTTLIVEDSGGSHGIEIQLWGEGNAQLLRDGKMYDVRWQRTGNATGLKFVDSNGNALPMKPGNTWLEMVPLDMAVKVN